MATLAQQIVLVLRRANGEKLDTPRLAQRLGLILGPTGEAAQNVARLAFETAKLAEYGLIEDNGRYSWIDPPRDQRGRLM